MPNNSYFEIVNTYEGLSKRAKYNRRLLSPFTNRWKKEYLLSLLEKYRPCKDSMFDPDIKINDVCILRNDHQKRAFWKLCKVEELIKGADGSVRSAKVLTLSDDGKKRVLIRSLKNLIPLEIRVPLSLPEGQPVSTSSHVPAQQQAQQQARQQTQQQAKPQCPTRARRNAALIGELLRRDNR